jgi:serine/threonine protein kinase/Tfp pilus assembly protein PilF
MNEAASEFDPVEEVAEEFLARYRRGERPALTEYTDKYPALADQIRELFPALLAMEQFGSVAAPATDSSGETPAGTAKMPEQLGEYRLLRELGRGGMGVVYEAVQESLGRHVALKVLPFHGLVKPTHLERFRREAKAAARLHHTNIVPVFGVGEHQGLHYYAMQFIQGQGLDAVLRELQQLRRGTAPSSPRLTIDMAQGLLTGRFAGPEAAPEPEPAPAAPPSARTDDTPPPGLSGTPTELTSPSEASYFRSVARLGVQVAEALAYAHRQGILHRDIKPSNLLLDRRGTVWVTDFGLAKPEGSDELTHPGDLVGTLRYMAPERLQGQSDPRSDVYSLGLTLYELATLRPAFADTDRARLIEQVRHDNPSPPRKLDRRIPHDLETIILKATDKELGRRYPTAAELAEDLRRFLADRPIEARRTPLVERTWRWCRRNPAVAALSSLALATLLAGLAAVGWQWRRAEQNWALADRQRQEAQANFAKARDAVDRLLTHVGEVDLRDVPQMEPLRRTLLEEALQFYQGFLQEKSTDPGVRQETGRAHRRLGDICLQLGRYAEAETHFGAAVALLTPAPADAPLEADAPLPLAQTYNALGDLLRRTGRHREAEDAYRQALARLEPWIERTPHDPPGRLSVADGYHNLGILLEKTGRLAEAETAYRQGLAHAAKLVADFPAQPRFRQALANRHNSLGILCRITNRPQEAEQAYRDALALLTQLTVDFPTRAEYRSQRAASHYNLGNLQATTDRLAEAEREYQQAEHLYKELVRDFPSVPAYRDGLAQAHFSLGFVGKKAGRLAEAETAYRAALDVSDQLAAHFGRVPAYRRRVAMIHNNLGNVLKATGRPQEAEQAYRQALAVYEELVPQYPNVPDYRSSLGLALGNVALALRDRGERDQARGLLQRAIDEQRAALAANPRHPTYRQYLRTDYANFAETLLQLGEPAEAARAAEEIPRLSPERGPDWYQAARLLARCAAVAEKAARQPEDQRPASAQAYADRALELLRTAVQKGFQEGQPLRTDEHWEALRRRTDFQQLLTELENQAPPARK